MLRVLVYVGDGFIGDSLDSAGPFGFGALVLGWCVPAFYTVGVFCYSTAD